MGNRKMKRQIGFLVFAALLPLFFAGGCATSSWEDDELDSEGTAVDSEGVEAVAPVETGLPLAVEQRFKDIPLPADLREMPERTYVYESPEIQLGRMVYTSKNTVNDLAQFFVRECPAADWELQSVLQADSTELRFVKSGKRLEIRIMPQGGVTRQQLLVINLTPDGATPGNQK
jgi:hypothetical protein